MEPSESSYNMGLPIAQAMEINDTQKPRAIIQKPRAIRKKPRDIIPKPRARPGKDTKEGLVKKQQEEVSKWVSNQLDKDTIYGPDIKGYIKKMRDASQRKGRDSEGRKKQEEPLWPFQKISHFKIFKEFIEFIENTRDPIILGNLKKSPDYSLGEGG
jgi:hypothetical protein